MNRRTRLERRTRIRAKRAKPRRGKTIIRLHGADMTALRDACLERDGHRCVQCGSTYRMEMAHIRTKRNNGDTLDNVRMLCQKCHRDEHNGGAKVCPKKEIATS